MADDENEDVVVPLEMERFHEGWLTKHKKIRGSWKLEKKFSNWKRRYFVLEGEFLYYNKSPKDNKFLGAIRMSKCSLEDASEATKRKHCFAIETSDGTSWLLDCESSADMENWMSAIRHMTSRLEVGEAENAPDGKTETELLDQMGGLSTEQQIKPLSDSEITHLRRHVETLKTGTDAAKKKAMSTLNSMCLNESVVAQLVAIDAMPILIRESLSSNKSMRRQAAIIVGSVAMSEANRHGKIPPAILKAAPALMRMADDEVQETLRSTLAVWGYDDKAISKVRRNSKSVASWSKSKDNGRNRNQSTDAEAKQANRNMQVMSRNIDQQLLSDAAENADLIKLLLLGAGESGKSTIFKQMKILHQEGYDHEDRMSYVTIIRNNLHTAIKCLIEGMEVVPDTTFSNTNLQTTAENLLQFDPNDDDFGEEVYTQIADIWADPNVKSLAEMDSQFQLPSSAKYYLDAIDRIRMKDYRPSDQDLLRARVRTSGIVSCEFSLKKHKFQMVDVGGQRNERRKWIHCFDDVTAILFVAAVSEFDQALFEDEETNRMHEALGLFQQICNSRWFSETSIILFLNKRDILEDKLKQGKTIRTAFPEYDGKDEYDPAIKYIRQQFLERKQRERHVYVHVTCATDTKNVEFVFNAVADTILRQLLSGAGLM